MDKFDLEFENIIPWNGNSDTGLDARKKWERNFERLKKNFGLLEEAFIEYLKLHIDNATIYWDEEKQVIKARGGSATKTYTITVGIDSGSVGKCTVDATGSVVSTTPSEDGATYTVVANGSGNVTVRILPEDGYEVQALNVDGVAQGAVSEYTFKSLDAGHTMYVWMAATEEVPVEFLVRSDLPGMYYSTTQDALNAVRATYPDGLTRDVTISCVKAAKEPRRGNIWLASMANWNNDSLHVLTIDGAGKLRYNCKSGGGIRFDAVDNIVCRNIDFLNYANGVEVGSPDELSAITFAGSPEKYASNLYIDSCRMDGMSIKEGVMATYSVITKNAENVYLVGNRIENCYCIPLKMVDCSLLSLVKNYIKADASYGIIGHPALCTLSNSHGIIAEDNEFTGDTGEYYFSLVNVERAVLRRNKFTDGGGEALNVSSKVPMKELTLDSNLFANMLSKPAVAWAFHYLKLGCSVEKMEVLNNTAYMCGNQWQQWFIRAVDAARVGTLDLYNNIVVDASAGAAIRGISLLDVGTVNSGHNLYAMKLNSEGVANTNIFSATGLNNTNSISGLQAQGLETGSDLVSAGSGVLDGSYRLLPELAYYSDADHLPAADADYKSPAAADNSRGCYNLAGTAIDEAGDTTTGYRGMDLTEEDNFNSSQVHTTYADNVLLLMHATLNRSKYIRLTATGTQHSGLSLGRYALHHPMPEVDGDGNYVRDELYTINIE